MGKDINWEITGNRFVGFIDIMGFKDMVMRNTHAYVYKIMKKISESTKFSSTIKWQGNTDLIKTSLYSDSLVIYSKDSTEESLHSIICTIANLAQNLLTEGIPFKGALSFGEMSIDLENSIFFGQPLIDAYLLQEEICFYGTVIHGSAQKIIENYSMPFIEEYTVLFKKGRNSHLTIPPMYFSGMQRAKDITRNEDLSKAVHKMKFTTSGHIRNYIDETEKYLKIISDKNPIIKE